MEALWLFVELVCGKIIITKMHTSYPLLMFCVFRHAQKKLMSAQSMASVLKHSTSLLHQSSDETDAVATKTKTSGSVTKERQTGHAAKDGVIAKKSNNKAVLKKPKLVSSKNHAVKEAAAPPTQCTNDRSDEKCEKTDKQPAAKDAPRRKRKHESDGR